MSDLTKLKPAVETVNGAAGTSVEGAKERLLAAAITLFCEKGYHATSVREIVEAAGVTKPVLYYYFQNKDGLFRSLIAETMESFRARLMEACEGEVPDFADRLRRIQASFLEDALAHPQIVRFMDSVAFSGQFEEIFDFRADWRANLDRITRVFSAAQASGEIRAEPDPEFLANAFIGLVVNQMRLRVYMPEAAIADGDLAELMMSGIRANRA